MTTTEEIQRAFSRCDYNFATIKHHLERLYLHSLVLFVIAIVEAILLVMR